MSNQTIRAQYQRVILCPSRAEPSWGWQWRWWWLVPVSQQAQQTVIPASTAPHLQHSASPWPGHQDSVLLSLLDADDGDSIMHCHVHRNPTTTLLISPILHSQAASVSKLFTFYISYGQLFSPQNAENIFSQTFVLVYQWTVIRAPGESWSLEDLLCPSP